MTKVEEYILARWCYAIGEDRLTDQEYRILENQVKEEFPELDYLNRSWSLDPCPIDLLNKHGLGQYYRNIKFTYQSESIASINNIAVYRSGFSQLNEKSRLSLKLDGWNTQVNYYNGEPISSETRGRSGNFMNANCVTKVAPQRIPVKGKVKVIGETIIPNQNWLFYKIQTGNKSQRASVSTALANNDIDVLQFVAYDIKFENPEEYAGVDHYELLKSWGFEVPYFVWVNDFQQLDKAIDRLTKMKPILKVPTDGLVIENSHCQQALRIKGWAEEVMTSYVKGIVERPGCYSNNIVIEIFPITVEDGSTKSLVNATNLQCIIDNRLEKGAPIAFDIRSATNCVVNTVATKDLQDSWAGRYELYREEVEINNKENYHYGS